MGRVERNCIIVNMYTIWSDCWLVGLWGRVNSSVFTSVPEA